MTTIRHKLLLRQLTREGLNDESLPQTLIQWQQFLKRVNNVYEQIDQERYLLERSMAISSQEMLDLNEKLEKAQQIAKLGYWFYNPEKNDFIWSKELYSMLKIDPISKPSWANFLHMINQENGGHFAKLAEKSLKEGTEFECEILIKSSDKFNRWFYMIGKPFLPVNKTSYELSGIAMDITARKQAQEKINILKEELIVSARQAGMAEVATSVLHNVGNILNSVNVSFNLLQENIRLPYYKKFFALRDLIKSHLPSITTYMSEDPQGKLIPQYFVSIADIIESHFLDAFNELSTLGTHLSHIREIITMQQSLGRTSGVMDKLFIPEIIDSALMMCINEKKNIKVTKDYNETPFLITDKTKLLQILVNIIQNAKESLVAAESIKDKEIIISIRKDDHEKLKIIITDNGVGINPENLIKIFSFGFSTKKNGHGFGLHSSALSAKELGGTLTANSKGENRGAEFTLTLPLQSCDKERSS